MTRVSHNFITKPPRLCRRRGTFSLSVGFNPRLNPEEQSSPATVANRRRRDQTSLSRRRRFKVKGSYGALRKEDAIAEFYLYGKNIDFK